MPADQDRSATLSTPCAVCGQRVRVSKGLLVRHRDAHGHACDNSRSSVEANEKGRSLG